MSDGFTVAVASGKGGTGKTTIATNLARIAAQSGRTVQYIDCDVEEPNGHIFLKPELYERREVTVDVPRVDPDMCTGCGKCGQICQYGAIVAITEQVLTFEKLCHSCGGCWRLCPAEAIAPEPMPIGSIEHGRSQDLDFVAGKLDIGHVTTPALIRAVKKEIAHNGLAILDVPPGTSCPVVTALNGADYVLLVTEPTPFGLNDLVLAVELVREMGLPFSVVINRDGLGDDRIDRYCLEENIDIAVRLPDDRRVTELYSEGHMIAEALPEMNGRLSRLLAHLELARVQEQRL
jgi:MinD superfamily P-loop ATPase